MVYKVQTSYLLVILMLFIQKSLSDPASVLKQVDQQTLLKQTDTQQKNQLLTSLSQEADILKQAYSAVVQSSTAAESTYTSYFNEQARCEGLNPQFDFVGDVSALPEDFCLVPPVGSAAIDVYTKSLQLLDLQYTASLNSKLVDQQTMFNADYAIQSSLYTKLTQASYVPLSSAVAKFQQCMKKYSTASKPTPVQCKAFNDTVNKLSGIYGKFRGQYVTFGMASKTPVLSLSMKQGVYTNSVDAVTRLNTPLQTSILQVKSTYNLCIANLQNIRVATDAALTWALASRNKVSDQNDKLNQIYTSIASYIEKIKGDTAKLKTLSASLKPFYP